MLTDSTVMAALVAAIHNLDLSHAVPHRGYRWPGQARP